MEPTRIRRRQTDMTRLCIVLFALVPLVVAGCGDDAAEVGAGGTSTTTTTPGEDPEDGDCAAHDDDGMCIDDPEQTLSGVEVPDCPPEADCTVTKTEPDPSVAAFAEGLRPACDEFQSVIDSWAEDPLTVGEALELFDRVEPAFDRWVAAAVAADPPADSSDEWRRLVDDFVETTEVGLAFFRDVFADLDPETPAEEAFTEIEAQVPDEVLDQDAATAAIDDFLGYSCLA